MAEADFKVNCDGCDLVILVLKDTVETLICVGITEGCN